MVLGLLIGFGIISILALLLSVINLIMFIAKEKATHTVQLVPVDEEVDRANQEYMKKWATSEEAIKKENKLYQEEVQDEMPQFALDDDDKEIFSI